MMAKKRKGKKGSWKMDPKISYILFPVFIAILIFLPIWAFSPFDQGLFITWVIAMSITLFGVYGHDKSQARSGGKRVPEIDLHVLSMVGGAAGGLIGMFFFRHKTRKKIFLIINTASAAVHGIIIFLQVT